MGQFFVSIAIAGVIIRVDDALGGLVILTVFLN